MGGPPKCLWLWSSCQPRHVKFVIKGAWHVRMSGEWCVLGSWYLVPEHVGHRALFWGCLGICDV